MIFSQPFCFSKDSHPSDDNTPALGGEFNAITLSILRILKSCMSCYQDQVVLSLQLMTNQVSSRRKAMSWREAKAKMMVGGNKSILQEWSKYLCITKPVDVYSSLSAFCRRLSSSLKIMLLPAAGEQPHVCAINAILLLRYGLWLLVWYVGTLVYYSY